jgi:hypothetical protein
MDPTRRVFRGLLIVLAVGLGALLAVPLAFLLAGALYVRLAGMGLLACARVLSLPPAEQSIAQVTSESQAKRMAS